MSNVSSNNWRHIYTEISPINFEKPMNEWCLLNNPHLLWIIQADIAKEEYEIWQFVDSGNGDRAPQNDFKCLGSFTSFNSAKVAYRLLKSQFK